MDTEKVRRTLRKITALTENIEEQGRISALERDLLLSYIRGMYEDVLSNEPLHESKPVAPQPQVAPPPASDDTSRDIDVEVEAEKQETGTTQNNGSNFEKEQETRESSEPSRPFEPDPREVRMPAGHSTSSGEEGKFDQLFATRSSGELAEKLQTQRISDIQSALGINERLLIINELFDGDHQLFDKTVEDLNSLEDFSDAKRYLIEGVASQHDWDAEDKVQKASTFVQVVRRRYA